MKAINSGTMMLRDGSPLSDLRLGGSKELALSSSTGEINASSNQELIAKIGELMTAVASGQVIQNPQTQMLAQASSEARRELLTEALADSTGQKWAALGSSLASKIDEQAERDGFARRLLKGNTLRQGEIQRVPMPAHDSMAVVATSSANVGIQRIRQRQFTPDEFELVANVRVDYLDLQQISGDLLDHAYNDGVQSIMVAEDRLWKKAADATVGRYNPLEYISGELTTKNLGRLRQAVAGWNLPATEIIISNDYWTDIIGSNDFATFLDPISKYDLVLNGQLGTLVGMNITTDAFRQPNQKVLNAGEIYVVADAQNHGSYSTRGGINSRPTDGANDGNTSRGWLLAEPFSLVIANARSVVKAKRV